MSLTSSIYKRGAKEYGLRGEPFWSQVECSSRTLVSLYAEEEMFLPFNRKVNYFSSVLE